MFFVFFNFGKPEKWTSEGQRSRILSSASTGPLSYNENKMCCLLVEIVGASFSSVIANSGPLLQHKCGFVCSETNCWVNFYGMKKIPYRDLYPARSAIFLLKYWSSI